MVFDKIKEILIEQLSLDESENITLDTSVTDDLGADSLDLFEVIMTIEEEFGIEIPEEKATEFKTVRDVVEYVDSVKE